MSHISQLHKAATWYAHHGYQVFPIVAGTKRPAVKDWENAATASTIQVEKWWSANPNYNIGIACGPSNLVVIDFDTYKSGVHTDILFDDDDLVNAVISRTPHGGTHVWFRQPDGMRLGNSRGQLPEHVDVRGQGGYIVAPPSLFEGKQYVFADDHRPTDCDPGALPSAVASLLAPEPRPSRRWQGERSAEAAEIEEALTYIPTRMSYEEWLAVLMAVHSVLPGDEGVALCEAWSPGYPGEIRKKFDSFDEGGISIGTLFHLAKQHGYRPPAPKPSEAVREQLFKARSWVWSAEFTTFLRGKGIRRAAELISVLDALLVLGHERGTMRVGVTHRTLADICDIAPMTAWRRVDKLKETQVIQLEKEENARGASNTIIDLSPMMSYVSDTDNTTGIVVSLTHEEMEWQNAHRTDDAFTSYPYWSAVKRRGGVAPLAASLGPTGWLLWPHLVRGGSLDELAEATGLSVSSIRHTIRKYMSLGLVPVEKVSKSGFYRLSPQAEETLDAMRPHMVTYGVGQMRIGRNHHDTANYAAFRLRQRRKMEPKDVRFWEEVRDSNDRRAALYFEYLDSIGFDARMKVGKERRVRHRIRIDYGEEWRTWGRPLFDAYHALGDSPYEDKVRLLALSTVGPDATPQAFQVVHKEMKEKVDMMLMMAPKRARYEQQHAEEFDAPAPKPLWQQLELELEVV